MKFQAMMDHALAFADQLLRHTDTFYPFAWIEKDGIFFPVFCSQNNRDKTVGMIEQLEWLVMEKTHGAKDMMGCIVYSASINELKNKTKRDGIVITCMRTGQEDMTVIYPYSRSEHGVVRDYPFMV